MSSTRATHYQLTFAVLTAGTAAYAILQSLVVPVLSTLQVELHTTQSTVTWVLTAYLLSASIFTPIMGRIGDTIGKEKVFVFTLVALALGCLLSALATNMAVMICGRVIQGIGGGAIPLAFGIIRDEFPREKVSSAIGAVAATLAVGAGLGIVLAGPIVSALDYHWLFWIPMVISLAAAIAAHFFVPESPIRMPGRISWLPAVLLSGWLVALLLSVSQAPTWGWVSAKVIGLLVAAIVLAGAWARSELRATTPLIDLEMMRRPAVWTNNVAALLLGFAMYGMFAFLPEFVQTPKSAGYGFGASITESGLMLLPSTVTMFFVGIYAGRFARQVGGKTVVIIGCVISVCSLLILAFAHGSTWEIYAATAVMGGGFGLVYTSMSSLIVSAVPPEQTGVASGMNANIRTIGGSLGAAVMASIVTARLEPSGLPKESGYTIGFAALSLGLVVATLVALLIPSTPPGQPDLADEPEHAELAILAAGTIVGDKPE